MFVSKISLFSAEPVPNKRVRGCSVCFEGRGDHCSRARSPPCPGSQTQRLSWWLQLKPVCCLQHLNQSDVYDSCNSLPATTPEPV